MKKFILLAVVFCTSVLTVGSAQAFLGFFIRAGLAYTTYKFADGVSNSTISDFVDDVPVDFICSFGEGAREFGSGLRRAASAFGDGSFGEAWQEIKQEFDLAFDAGKKEWERRRAEALVRKAEAAKVAMPVAPAAPIVPVPAEPLQRKIKKIEPKPAGIS